MCKKLNHHYCLFRRLDIENLIAKQSNLSGSTIPRRALSLFSWFKWITEVTGSLVLKEGIFWSKD